MDLSLISIRLACVAAGLAGALAVGCPGKERAPGADRSPTTESSPADELLRSLSRHADAVVSVTGGTEHFGKGLVTLSVHGTGRIQIINRRSGKTTTYEGKLTTAQVEQLGRTFSDAGFTTLESPGPPRAPGDTPVVLEVRRGDRQVFRRELWHGDRYQQPGLDTILKRSDAIVTETTNGELPY